MKKKWQPTLPPFREFKRKTFQRIEKVSQFIYQIGEYPALRQVSSDVPLEKITTKEYQDKFNYIKKCLIHFRKLTGYGRGITAVQVGIPERFSVIYTPNKLMIIINPKVLKVSDKQLKYPEICMSVDPVIAPVIRPAWVEFSYYNENGEKMIWKTIDDTDLGKMMNRVIQHELDHMEGIVNIDKVESPKELILESDPNFYATAGFEEI